MKHIPQRYTSRHKWTTMAAQMNNNPKNKIEQEPSFSEVVTSRPLQLQKSALAQKAKSVICLWSVNWTRRWSDPVPELPTELVRAVNVRWSALLSRVFKSVPVGWLAQSYHTTDSPSALSQNVVDAGLGPGIKLGSSPSTGSPRIFNLIKKPDLYLKQVF